MLIKIIIKFIILKVDCIYKNLELYIYFFIYSFILLIFILIIKIAIMLEK